MLAGQLRTRRLYAQAVHAVAEAEGRLNHRQVGPDLRFDAAATRFEHADDGPVSVGETQVSPSCRPVNCCWAPRPTSNSYLPVSMKSAGGELQLAAEVSRLQR